jgi:predicted 2-oxoglutarate/Fe(II)-dependent dioxygenase YbiX
MQLSPGDPFPHLQGRTPTDFMRMDYMPGRYIVLAFLPDSAPRAEIREVMAALAKHDVLFDDTNRCFFGVLNHSQLIASAQDSPPGIRWFLDPNGDLFRQSGVAFDGDVGQGGWIILDPSLRIMKTGPLSQTADIMRWVSALPPVNDHAGTRIVAPVLIVPRVFEAELCAELIAMHRNGPAIEGSVLVGDDEGSQLQVDRDYRSTRQLSVTDPDLKARIEDRLLRRLAPEMMRGLRYEVRDIESCFVAAYDAAEGGRFRAHRDNLAPLQHRQFTFAINLNAEDYEGGDLRFLEFGTETYRAPTGGAIVFASSLLHEVTLITSGRRYVLLAWFIDRPMIESDVDGEERRCAA